MRPDPYIAPLRPLGSTTPTVRLDRPSPTSTPTGWSATPKAGGLTLWTWSDERGVPVASVMVSALGEVAPVSARDPERYWMDGRLFARAATALASLAAYLEQAR